MTNSQFIAYRKEFRESLEAFYRRAFAFCDKVGKGHSRISKLRDEELTKMGFMKPEKVYGDWYEVEDGETTWFPAEYFTADQLLDQATEDATVAIRRNQWGVRLSAPGYLDCTDWEVFETEAEADERIAEWEEESDL